MSSVDRLNRDAMSAYTASRFSEALLLFRQAAREAEMLGDRPAWFQNLVWAGSAAENSGDLPQAQRLFLEARAGEPPDRPDYAAKIARTESLEIAITHRPVLSRLIEQLNQLREFAQEHPVPPADIEWLTAGIELQRGHFAGAQEGYERAWQKKDTATGYIKELHAEGAVECCLAMGDAKGALHWIAALEGVVSSFDNLRRTMATRFRLHLALLEAEPSAKLRGQLRAFDDAAVMVDDRKWKDKLAFARVRFHLLDPNGGDPAQRTHPARQALTHRLASRWNVHLRFDRWLVFLDYRLAALRYAVGAAPVDDLYYTKPQQIPARKPAVVTQDDIADRFHRARAALRGAMAYAKKLDDWLECDWRQKQVEDRRQRIEEIAQARHA